MNDYFSDLFYYIFLLCLCPFFFAGVIYFMFFCMTDSPWSRKTLACALLLAWISSFLMFLWIVIYISLVYPRDDLWIGSGKAAEPDE